MLYTFDTGMHRVKSYSEWISVSNQERRLSQMLWYDPSSLGFFGLEEWMKRSSFLPNETLRAGGDITRKKKLLRKQVIPIPSL